MFVVAELTETNEDDAFMTMIAQILNTATAGMPFAILSYLKVEHV